MSFEKLAEQANWYKPNSLPSDWDSDDYIVSPTQMREFAALVIQDVLNVLHDNELWNRHISEAVREYLDSSIK